MEQPPVFRTPSKLPTEHFCDIYDANNREVATIYTLTYYRRVKNPRAEPGVSQAPDGCLEIVVDASVLSNENVRLQLANLLP